MDRYPIRTPEPVERGSEYYYVVGRSNRELLCAGQNPWKNANNVSICTLSRTVMRGGEHCYRRLTVMRALLALQEGGFLGCLF